MTLVLAQAMLVLSLLFVRPVPDRLWPARLLLQAVLLAACLATAALTLPAPVSGRCLIGLLAAGAGIALYAVIGDGWPRTLIPGPGAPLAWLLAGLLFAGLAIRLLRPPVLPAGPAGVLAVSLGTLLSGLLGALAARGPRARSGALLLAADGLMLAACLLPGIGAAAPVSLVLIEAGLLCVLLRRPPAGDEAAEAVRSP